MILRRFLPAVVCCFLSLAVHAQQETLRVRGGDTLHSRYTPQSAAATGVETPEPPKRKDNFWSRIFHGNVDRTFEKKIDFSFIGAPNYSKEASVGIGVLASGLYRIDRTDSLTPPSDVSFFGNFSLSGFYLFGVSGNTLFNHNRSRVVYEASFASKPLDFWGIGYDAGRFNESTDYIRKQVKFDAGYLYEVWKHLYVGGSLLFAHTKGTNFDERGLKYLAGAKLHYTSTGIGVTLQYDSRDFIPAPERGTYLMVKQVIYPKGLGNCGRTLYKTTATADYYQRLWRGAVLATDIFGEFNSSGMPWCMLAELGGGYRMRGYYQGRYLDNNILSCQIEYRQRIWRRIGCAVWGGAGNVFSSFERFRWDQTLPNYGLGVRWEFKHRVNVRIDYGFGRKTSGLVFNLNEAF